VEAADVEERLERFRYSAENVRGSGADADAWIEDIDGCDCGLDGKSCDTEQCFCNRLFGSPYVDGRLRDCILQGLKHRPILECGSNCACLDRRLQCGNRFVGSGPKTDFLIFECGRKGLNKGLGLKALRDIQEALGSVCG